MKTPNPPDLNRVLEKINEIARESAIGNYIYRGEPQHHDKVSSGLYREYADIEAEHFDIAIVQEDILREAREYTFHKMEDFELTATLQHHGDKTNLIDFTTDYLVALFFACDGEFEEPGRVILLQIQSESEVCTVKKPPKTIRRAEIQKSIFVQAPKGFVEPDKVVCVPAELKLALLNYLGKYHDISTETIYNDLQGFIENRGFHKSAYTEFYKGLTYQDRGDSAETHGEKQKWYDEAIKHYTKAVHLKRDLVEVYNNRGATYAEKGDFESAIQDCNTAIDLNPNDADAYNNRGATYAEKGDFESAIQDYNTAIDLNPNGDSAYNNRGAAYAKKGDFESAIQDYTKAIDLNPKDATTYRNRGIAYGNKGDFENAIQDYNRAVVLEPNYAQAYYNRMGIWLHLKDWKKAKADLTAVKDMGVNVVASFRNDYESVKDFEEKNDAKVPEDIAALLR